MRSKHGVRLIEGPYGRVQSGEMLRLLGVKSLPRDGMAEQTIQGVRVYVAPLVPGWGKRQNGGWQGLRVTAICDCGRHIPVGRLHQHICKKG